MVPARIGHAHLKVRDLDRACAFYARFFGLRETERVGDQYVFLSGGELHHEIALQRVAPDAPAPPAHGTGLYHVAFEVAGKREFAAAYRALLAAGVPVAPVDHLISWALYFDDPDGNGLEIYCDTRNATDGAHLWGGINRPLPAEVIEAPGDA
ncbi:MAG: VOC family protein [Ktedonobacterales bacterium]